MTATCPVCGTRRGLWHAPDCQYRLGFAMLDEMLCQHIGRPEHEENWREYKEIMELRMKRLQEAYP